MRVACRRKNTTNRFFDYVEINAEVHYLPYFGDTFAVHDVEFGAAERRSHLVLDDFDFGSCTELLFTVLDAGGFADIDADTGIEFQCIAAGGRFRIAIYHAYLVAELVDEDADRFWSC